GRAHGRLNRHLRRNADRVSVVIMDTTMPRMGGREAIRHIRDVRDDVPLIVASGSMQPTEGDPVDDHIAAFLLKPYRPSEMVQRVREVIRARGEPRASTGAQEV
ncbi:MAG TPA: response regulator, partial [Armatimonadota bacterium]|nr:response regulator [Armatimonadota bacterium]